jgi:tetratricopeptide (TPR) repeat protein
MSTSWSRRPSSIGARNARPGHPQRNGRPAAPGEPSPTEYNGRPRAVPDLPHEAAEDRRWDERVAREVRHQEVIEASFDRADAYARLGDFERALEWLDRAAAVSGGLPPAYRAQRAGWARAAALRPRPAGGDWKDRLARSGERAPSR